MLGLELPELDVREAEFLAAAARNLEHRRAEVTRDEPSALAEQSRNREPTSP